MVPLSAIPLMTMLIAFATIVHAQCVCPELEGVAGVYGGNADGDAIECAYPDGACLWDSVRNSLNAVLWHVHKTVYSPQSGTLLNRGQPNCQYYIPPYVCPLDLTNASGTLIHHIKEYYCTYTFPNASEIACSWNAVRTSLFRRRVHR